tara:strand:+ start:37 stop:318 length:282 start_codon:yes stop_codon:yes gene_type:complete
MTLSYIEERQIQRLTTKQAEVENRRLATEKLFNEFWLAYPKKNNKGAAKKAYLIALQKSSHAKILAGLARYIFDESSICDPSTWLNQERWDYE